MIAPILKVKKVKRNVENRIDPDLLYKVAQNMNIPPNIKWFIRNGKLVLQAQETRIGTSIMNPLNKGMVEKIKKEFTENVRAELYS